MKLPESVIKRFASLTKSDDKKTTSSGIFYGTIKSVGSNPTVQLDGSTVTTPVILGAAAKEGDRVTVSIADHKATVSSNITNPASAYAAKDLYDDTVTPVKLIKADKIDVDDLFAQNITATGVITGATLKSENGDGGILISNSIFRSYSQGVTSNGATTTYTTTINCGQIRGESHVISYPDSSNPKIYTDEEYYYDLNPHLLSFSDTDAKILIGAEDGYAHYYVYTGHGIYYSDMKMLGFGEDDNGFYMFSDPTYARPYHSSTANVVITSNGVFGSTNGSSKRWKHDIADIRESVIDPTNLYDAKVRQFKYNDDHIAHNDERYNKLVPGLIAEELDEVYPIAVAHETHEDGTVTCEDWELRYMVPAMLYLIQEQNERLKKLEE